MLLAAEPQGRMIAARRRPRGRGDPRPEVWFPIQRGFMRRTVGHIKAVNGATLSVRAGETLGIVGRIRLGQDDAGAGDHAG